MTGLGTASGAKTAASGVPPVTYQAVPSQVAVADPPDGTVSAFTAAVPPAGQSWLARSVALTVLRLLTLTFCRAPAVSCSAVGTAPLQCASRALMLFAINDNPSVTSANGGSHWTLLACRKSGASAASFTHYDSLPRSGNAPVAARVAKTLTSALGWSESCARVTAAPAPAQTNGHDCALHVMLTASLLCELHSRDPGREPTREELAAYVTPPAATQLRRDAHALIVRLAAEADDAPWDD